MKNRLYKIIHLVAVGGVLLTGLTGLVGCSKPAATEQARDKKGNLQFPDTGRLPTEAELAKINKNRQPGQPPTGAPAPPPAPGP